MMKAIERKLEYLELKSNSIKPYQKPHDYLPKEVRQFSILKKSKHEYSTFS